MCNVNLTKFITGSLPCGDGTCITADLFCNGVPNCNSSTTIFTDEMCDFDNLRCPQTQFKVTYTSFYPSLSFIGYEIIGEGSQISTNQERESTVKKSCNIKEELLN